MPFKKFVYHLLQASLIISACFFIPATAFAQDAFLDFCLESYLTNKSCPEKTCELRCIHNTPDCVQMCLPKECTKIPAKDCPLKYCEVMTDCSDEKICHYKMTGEKPECGNLAYAGQDAECCDGLIKRCGVAFLDGRCDMEGKNSVYNLPICIPCGDGVCGQFEDRCNCPEDCQRKLKKSVSLPVPKNVAIHESIKSQPAAEQKTEGVKPKIIEINPKKK